MMLNLEQLRSITCGADRVEENNGEFHFYRFTEAQTEAYRQKGNEDHYGKTFATSGVRLAFRTNAKALSFTYRLEVASSRSFGHFDLYINGNLARHFGVDGREVTGGSVCVPLDTEECDVELYLPWSRAAILSNVSLEGGDLLLPKKRNHTMIAFGDSITQGYDALYPSLAYATALARLLDADSINKGIGGERFFPALADSSDAISPEYITVAYGTNDWSGSPKETFLSDCRAFYEKLSARYPDAKIFAITPICRLDASRKTNLGEPIAKVGDYIREFCADLPNVTVIDGWNLTPAIKEFYSDAYLHPNDLGFGLYAQNLFAEISKHL
jgi:lysophospholipase L1-like esterase